MANIKRKLVPDGVYHVYNRAVKKSLLFKQKNDYEYFFNRIFTYKKKFDFSVYAVCLMSNHFHILIQDNGSELPLIMDSIESSYAKRYSRKYDHKGYVFESRFKSNLIVEESSFLKLYRYVVRNPVVAGLSDRIVNYEWVTPDPAWDRFNIIDFGYINKTFRKACNSSYDEYIESNVDDMWVDEIEVQRLDDGVAYDLYISIKNFIHKGYEAKLAAGNEEKLCSVIRISLDRGITYKQLVKFTGLTYYRLKQLTSI